MDKEVAGSLFCKTVWAAEAYESHSRESEGKTHYIFQATKTPAQSGKLAHVEPVPSPTHTVSAPTG